MFSFFTTHPVETQGGGDAQEPASVSLSLVLVHLHPLSTSPALLAGLGDALKLTINFASRCRILRRCEGRALREGAAGKALDRGSPLFTVFILRLSAGWLAIPPGTFLSYGAPVNQRPALRQRAAAEKAAATEWSLSERAQLLVQQLGKE